MKRYFRLRTSAAISISALLTFSLSGATYAAAQHTPAQPTQTTIGVTKIAEKTVKETPWKTVTVTGKQRWAPKEALPLPEGRTHLLEQHAKPLPESAAVEGYASYVPQTTCDPGWRKGVQQFRNLLLAVYPETFDWGSYRDCARDGISEHLDGRAWDWKVDVKDPEQLRAATDVLGWLVGEGPNGEDGYWAKRLGVMYMGYNGKIWGAYRAGEGWRPLPKTDPHKDHVHFSFSWNGARGKTSFWTGKVASEDYGPCRFPNGMPAPLRTSKNTSPCPYGKTPITGSNPKIFWLGSSGQKVKTLQESLGLAPTGVFDLTTRGKVVSYQKSVNLPITGYLTKKQRKTIIEESKPSVDVP